MNNMKIITRTILTILTILEIYKIITPQTIQEKIRIQNQPFYKSNMSNMIKMSMMIKEIERSANYIKKKMRNKMMHMKNGNREKEKKYTHYKLLNINKGNSDFKTYQDELKKVINDKKADIVTITESNLGKNDEEALKPYKDKYNIENKIMTGAEKGRVTCLIRKGINYKRLENHELPTSSLIFIKIKCSQRKSFIVGAYYREWQQPSGVPGPNTRELEDQLERLKHAMEKVVEVSKVEDEIILNGDMIDILTIIL